MGACEYSGGYLLILSLDLRPCVRVDGHDWEREIYFRDYLSFAYCHFESRPYWVGCPAKNHVVGRSICEIAITAHQHDQLLERMENRSIADFKGFYVFYVLFSL